MDNAPVGMAGIVSQLTTGLSAEKLLSVVSDVMPFVILMVPIALGLYFLRKAVKGASKGKVRF